MENDRCWLPLKVRDHDDTRDTSWDDYYGDIGPALDIHKWAEAAVPNIIAAREVLAEDEAEWNKRRGK
jgi:hypothetical protein